jgi:hypothetical protein
MTPKRNGGLELKLYLDQWFPTGVKHGGVGVSLVIALL